jgi:phosphate-selective porin OprO/OprP
MRPKGLRFGLVAAGTTLLSVCLAVGAFAQSSFYREVTKDGRIYVFNNPAQFTQWEGSGEAGVGAITLLGSGPNGETMVFDSENAIHLYNFKHDRPGQVFKTAAVAVKPPAMSVTWKDGKTTIQTDKMVMAISNRIQVRYTQELPDSAVKLAGTPAAGDSKGSFRIRRAKFKMEGWFYKPELEYEVQLNWPDVTGSPASRFMEDANIDWDISKNKTFRIRFGQFKAPYGRQQLTSSGAQQFVDRSIIDERYNPGRETGLALWGTLGQTKLDWRVMVSNGNGRSQSANDNNKFLYTARLQWQPTGATRMNQWGSGALLTEGDLDSTDKPLFAVAGNYLSNNLYDTTTTLTSNLKNAQWSGDGIFKYRGFAAVAEYHLRQSTPQSGDKFKDKGWYGQASYAFRAPKLGPAAFVELAARYAQIDPSDAKTSDKRTEVGGAVSYYYNKHNFKIQADYREIKDEAKKAGEQKSKEFRLQTQFIF